MDQTSRSVDALYANASQAGASSRRVSGSVPGPSMRTARSDRGSSCTKCTEAMREMGITDADLEDEARTRLGEAEEEAAEAEALVASRASQLSAFEERSARIASHTARSGASGRRSRSRAEVQQEMDEFLGSLSQRPAAERSAPASQRRISTPSFRRRSLSPQSMRSTRSVPMSPEAEAELNRLEEYMSQPIEVTSGELVAFSRSRSRSPPRSGLSVARAEIVGNAYNPMTGIRGHVTEYEGGRRYYVAGSEVARDEFLMTFRLD